MTDKIRYRITKPNPIDEMYLKTGNKEALVIVKSFINPKMLSKTVKA